MDMAPLPVLEFLPGRLWGKCMDKRPLAWPHGKRVAVVCSVLLETWSDGKAPSYFPRTTPLPPGSKDVAGPANLHV